jgi:hypothetical protein
VQFNGLSFLGLDIGLAICTILIFCTLSLTSTAFPAWWGTNIESGQPDVLTTLDAADAAIQVVLNPGEKFGPATW